MVSYGDCGRRFTAENAEDAEPSNVSLCVLGELCGSNKVILQHGFDHDQWVAGLHGFAFGAEHLGDFACDGREN